MSELYDCPQCGKKDSAWDDGLCGACEKAQREWDEKMEQEEQEKYCKKYGGYFDRNGNWMEGE